VNERNCPNEANEEMFLCEEKTLCVVHVFSGSGGKAIEI
jgi:hypothetical protein